MENTPTVDELLAPPALLIGALFRAKRAELEAAGISLDPWKYANPRDLAPPSVDDRRRAKRHGDPLLEAIA